MKNVVFVSPNFPTNYWHFCQELREDGVNVLGIGDQPWHELSWEQQNSLTEYYKVDSLENYDEVYRAVAFFTFKYGRIDFLESNNEYWLDQNAHLRTDFNIPGFKVEDLHRIRYKSGMKEYYRRAGIPTARCGLRTVHIFFPSLYALRRTRSAASTCSSSRRATTRNPRWWSWCSAH